MQYDIKNPSGFFEDHKKGLLNISFRSDIFVYFGYSRTPNARTRHKVLELFDNIETFLVDCTSVTKTCPQCLIEFTKLKRDETKTCSHACSNMYFSHKRLRPDSAVSYRIVCFRHHKKECVVCKETVIVEAHHYDENHENNEPSNFVPLCPTHHRYWHSRHKHLIEDVVHDYVKQFKAGVA